MTTCENCQQFDRLKHLAGVVVVQYQSLQEQYTQVENQNHVLINKLNEREEQLKKMKKLIEPAISEYEKMKMKYEIEVGCRTQAEKFATKISSQNKELKRQSQMLLDLRGSKPLDFSKLNLDLNLESEKDTVEEYNKELAEKLQKLEEELAETKTLLGSVEEDLEIEREKKEKYKMKSAENEKLLKQTENSLKQYKDAMEELSKVSEDALTEYESLKEKYELEVKCRSGAEKYAAEIRIQNEAMKKQSTILLSSAASNPQLLMALNNVEILTTQMEEQKLQYESQIKELQDKLDEMSDSEVKKLEEENDKLIEEKEKLENKLMEYDQQYKDLEKQYKEVEEKLETALRPPPPPPPPPPPVPTSKGFLSKAKKEKKETEQPAGKAPPGMDHFSKALEEMMNRINSGTPLSQTLRPAKKGTNDNALENITEESTIAIKITPSEPEEKSSAMAELNSILSKVKRTQSETDLTGPKPAAEKKTELQKIFERRAKKQEQSASPKPHVSTVQVGGPKHLSAVNEESSEDVFDKSKQ